MACFYPLNAWRKPVIEHGQVTGHEIVFTSKGSQLDNDLQLPCGKCSGCRADRAREWAIRMVHEATCYDRNCFVTLTYDQEHCPTHINRTDPQKFIKRLRHHSDTPLRYFITGEYGEQTRRPHYHAVIFGEDFRGGAYDIDQRLYGNVILDRIWKQGATSIGEFNEASAMYVAGYVQKKINDPDTFSIMSKGSIRRTRGMLPPIGYRWAEQNIEELARIGHVVVNGQRHTIPAKYFEWFPLELDHLAGMKASYVKERDQQQLRNREKNHNGRIALKSETI